MDVAEAVATRRSVRAFTDEAVDRTVLDRVLSRAQRAPSGGNLQPWHAVVLTGEPLEALRATVGRRLESGEGGPPPEYPIYPPSLWSPYRDRRYANGEQLYAALEIPREDRDARLAQFARNWQFFDAPVGLLLFVDRRMNHPQWADLGIWLQTVMLLLVEEGLASCPQEAWSAQHDLASDAVRDVLPGVDDELMLFCGLAIGHEDTGAPVNGWVSDRAPLEESVTYLG